MKKKLFTLVRDALQTQKVLSIHAALRLLNAKSAMKTLFFP